jgi:hypothetical protein
MSPGRTTARRAPARGATTGRTRRRPIAGSRRAGARKGARRTRRLPAGGHWWPGLVLVVAVLAAIAWQADAAPGATGRCVIPLSAVTVTPEQAANAATIAEVAHSRGLPDRAVVIALATARQESGLRNLDHGDRDSLGLFQQRPSQGWGTPEEVRDPFYAASKFYERLVSVPNWRTGRLTEIAQSVQRSGAPEAYQKHEAVAVALTAALAAGNGKLDCG